ncbi:MAG: site-specific integrase, partial [Rhodobacteraceae bacterium]|nr:site-specific integrase [Paracoccaceae bacterium]
MPLTLFRRKPRGPYYARGTVAGQRIYESTGLGRRADAQAWANRRENQILQRHALGERATLTFAEAAHEYLMAGCEARFLVPILDYFGPDARVAEIDNSALLKAAAALYPDAAPATINRQLIGPVSAVINQAAENGRADPRKFRRLKARGARTRWLSPAEMERLMDAAAPHLLPILA